MAEERSETEGRVSEAERGLRAAEVAQTRLEQEKQSLTMHNSWLEAELKEKSEQLLAHRKEASEEVRAAQRSARPPSQSNVRGGWRPGRPGSACWVKPLRSLSCRQRRLGAATRLAAGGRARS